jgi:putative DNA primase/helicase
MKRPSSAGATDRLINEKLTAKILGISCDTLRRLGHPPDLAGLHGARLVTSVETEEGRRWAESKIKALTGGDKIAARFMRQDFFEFTPQFKLVIAGNHKPGLRSVDEAIRWRLNLIPFTVTIPSAERDPDLAQKLRAGWPGILAWAVEGCLAWQRDGLAAPAAVTSATAAYLEAEDATGAWMNERCEEESGAVERSNVLYSSWKDWAEKAGEPIGSQKKLSQKLEDRDLQTDTTDMVVASSVFVLARLAHDAP